jgi:hypothetical protein
MSQIDPVILRVEELISLSRLNELAIILSTDRTARLARIAAALQRLDAGSYLLGTGPSTVGIIRLSVEEIVLGRAATPLERPRDTVIDFAVGDTLYFSPHEVSRVHAKVVRRGDRFYVVDMGSRLGTFVNGNHVDPQGEGVPLSHGDVLSLGPSRCSTYVFYVATPPT